MMTDRDLILERLSKLKPENDPPYYLSDRNVHKDQLVELFSINLRAAGGDVLKTGKKQLTSVLDKIIQDGGLLINLSENTLLKTKFPHWPGNPGSINSIQLLVMDGLIGVAENGAVWIPESCLGERRFPFIVERILILLDLQNLVHDLSQAYRKINLSEIPFGLLIAGPSKTADIEQSLVIGAQGAMQHTVLILT
jgi:L-lactate dehydrogenase complex protein LldG